MLRLVLILSALPAMAQALTVAVSFSDKAAAELSARGEMVTLAAYYMGDPAPVATLPETEIGTIQLGTEAHTFWPVAQQITLGTNIANAPLDQVTQAMVNINIFSARLTDEDNLLDCGFIDAPLAEVDATVQPLFCKLIGE